MRKTERLRVKLNRKSEMFNLSGYALQLICCYMVWGTVFGARPVGVVSESDV